MYASRRKKCSGRCYETLLLGRTIFALKGCYVSIELLNGCYLTGYIASYKGDIITANLFDSLNDLHLVESAGATLTVPPRLRNVYESFKCRTPSQSKPRRISRSPPLYVVIHDATVSCNRYSYRAAKVEVHERWITTVSPSTLPSNLPSTINTSHKSNPSAAQLKHMILQEPCDKIKNTAFLRCSRIGQNNLE